MNLEALRGAVALEPGGPSGIFTDTLPVYPLLSALDTLDFAPTTLWAPPQGVSVRRAMVGEGGALEGVQPGAYDAVIASHVLEHMADPLGALARWRAVAPLVLLVLPHREGTFDHRRPVTTLEHMRDDAARHTPESDTTHIAEALALHDLARDPGCPSRTEFERRCRANLATRGLHHHVFDTRRALEACESAGLSVIALELLPPFHIVVMCNSSGRGLSERVIAETLHRGPFPSDRAGRRMNIYAVGGEAQRPPEPPPPQPTQPPPSFRVVCGYTPGRLHPAAKAALLAQAPHTEFIDVSGAPDAYFEMFRSVWLEARDFAMVEHDIVIAPGTFRSFDLCEEPWCSCAVGINRHPEFVNYEAFFQCNRWRAEVMVNRPNACELPMGQRHWSTLDGYLLHWISLGRRPATIAHRTSDPNNVRMGAPRRPGMYVAHSHTHHLTRHMSPALGSSGDPAGRAQWLRKYGDGRV